MPCLRVDGRFFASYDRRTGDLLVKLPEAVVNELVRHGRARPFVPAGRRFREWAAVPAASSSMWSTMLDEAFTFVAG